MADDTASPTGQVLELVLKTTGLLAAAGYISLRAHLNMLGVTSPVPLTVERYLMEVWQLVLWLVDRYALVALVGLLVAAGVSAIPLARVKWRWWDKHPRMRSALLPLFLLVASLLLTVHSLRLRRSFTDVAVHLTPDLLQQLGQTRKAFIDLVLLCACALLAVLWRRKRVAPPAVPETVWWQRGMTLASIVLVLQVPLLYGMLARSRDYPLALARTEQESFCGLLVLATEAEVSLWRARANTGEIISLQREGLAGLQVGRLHDILNEARAAMSGAATTTPDCMELSAWTLPPPASPPSP